MSPRRIPNRATRHACLLLAVWALGCSANGGDPAANISTFRLPDERGPAGAADAKSTAPHDAEVTDAEVDKSGDTVAEPIDAGPSKDASTGDLDGDGFSPAKGDCNDDDPLVFPGAIDACDGKDNDCDGKTDWFDKDGDGYSPAPCDGQQTDCDDTDAAIHPGGKANCDNGKDNDCDGKPDADTDVDGDSYPSCVDCNDLVATIHPDAPIDCSNKKDNNCDGVIDSAADGDQDGSPGCADCNDADPQQRPGLLETCDGKDNDCNEVVDDMDMDGDSYSGCAEDCDDNDINIHPGSPRNCKNGKDNDCNGKIDANEDGDGDGFSGCQDCNDNNPYVNSGALEFVGDLIDNNCNGQIDEPPLKCDKAGLGNNVATDYPLAMDLCIGVQQSVLAVDAGAKAHALKQKYGPQNLPVMGPNMVVLSSGNAAAAGDSGYVVPQSGTSFSNSASYPPGGCPNSGTVYDYTEWKLTLKVPSNAQAFSFEFNFMSAEYPEYVGTQFNDKFFAILDSKKFKGNVSFDSKGNCISINNALFNVCQGCSLGASALAGTGYENGIGGGTGWLTTTVPVTPGETVTLKFMIFDEGDHIYDSAVLLDHFRWQATAKKGGPSTVRPGG